MINKYTINNNMQICFVYFVYLTIDKRLSDVANEHDDPETWHSTFKSTEKLVHCRYELGFIIKISKLFKKMS